MSSYNGLLNIGSSAMSVQKYAMSVTGNNIANASSAGYAAQRLEVNPATVVRLNQAGALGTGAAAGSITRSFDVFTYQRILGEESRRSFYDVQETELSTINAAYNESSLGGLTSSLNDLFTAFNQISANPEGISEREVALADAETLVNRFHTLSDSLVSGRNSLDDRIETVVTSVNEAASEIARLNREIALAEASGGSAGNLRSRREALARELAQKANITVVENANGSYAVHLANYVLVQDDRFNTLSTTQNPANSNLLDINIDSDGTQINITSLINDGELGGILELRDTRIPQFQTDLDDLAFELVNNVNAVHAAGFGLDGVTGRDFFDPLAVAAGAASLIQLDAAVQGNPDAIAASSTAAGLPGDNANAIALYQLSEQALVGGAYTFAESATIQSSNVGTALANAGGEVSYQDKVLGELDVLQQSIQGVSVDEEATNMLSQQSAYQAAARFVSAVQEMMDTLLRM